MAVVKGICQEVAIIGDGKLVENGTVGDIFAHPKTDLAREFIRSTLDLSIPADYEARLQATRTENSYPLIRLEFTGASVDAPVISHVAREFDIDISILSSNMDYVGGVKFGLMLAEFIGPEACAEKAIQYLKEQKIELEVLGYVI